MRSHRWRSVQSGLPESAHGCPELVKHALLVEANGMCRNTGLLLRAASVGCSGCSPVCKPVSSVILPVHMCMYFKHI